MKGTRTVKMDTALGTLSINAITPEARELLDKLCKEYEKMYGGESIHNTGSVYSTLYWAVRYSGLVGPNIDLEKLAEEIKAELTNGWSNYEIKHEWDSYLEEEIKPYYPTLYAFLKEVPSDTKKT